MVVASDRQTAIWKALLYPPCNLQ